MSRYTTTFTRAASGEVDRDTAIGYGRSLQSFFLQASVSSEDDDLEHWFGRIARIPDAADFRTAARERGFDFVPMASGMLYRLVDDQGREAVRPAGKPSSRSFAAWLDRDRVPE